MKIKISEMMNLLEKVKAIRYENGKDIEKEEILVNDQTTNLIINGMIKRNLSSVNDSLKEFTIGYLFGEKLIFSLDDIEKFEIKGNHIKVDVKEENIKNIETLLCSDAGGGRRRVIDNIKPVKSNFTVKANEIIENMIKLTNHAPLWQATGGTHVAALISENKFIVKEDVSRHVAVDKVIGAGILENIDFSNSYITYSGRMPADMVIKIVRAGIPLLASNAAPANSGYKIAKKGNVTLVGFIRKNRFNVYNNQNRVQF